MKIIKPTGDRILVEVEDRKDKVELILPKSYARKQKCHGKVVEAGPKAEFKKGDSVIFGKETGHSITKDKIDYLIMRSCDVVAVPK